MIIYKAVHKISGKVYVGKTKRCLSRRIYEHGINSIKHSGLFYNALFKNGTDGFEWIVIDKASTPEELNKLERHYIKELNTLHPNGYNLTTGGDGGGRLGFKQTESTKLKMSLAKKGKKLKPFTSEHKKKISESRTGQTLSISHRNKISASLIGRKPTVQTKESKYKISQTKKKKFLIKRICFVLSTIIIKE